MKHPKLDQKDLSPRPYAKPPSVRARDAIEEAMANGAFDNLPGAGKPLDFSDDDNPFIPADMRLAWRMLRQHKMVLPWIDDRREIETSRTELQRQRATHLQRMRSQSDSASTLAPHLQRYRVGKMKAEHGAFVRSHLEAIDRLNDKIDRYNLAVPSITLQTHRVNRERVREQLDEVMPDQSASERESPATSAGEAPPRP